jgi:hypothetical protein
MKSLLAILMTTLFAGNVFADTVIWEMRQEIPIGKACPVKAERYDSIAFQVGADGGYVCFTCDYTSSSPFLLVTEQTRCPRTMICKNGKCE